MKVTPQRKNANRHTQRGMGMLEGSIEQDGWIGAITTAADGETFDGSARVEVTAANGMLADPIVIDSDGTRPIVVRRTDIPSADDPRARRLGVAANRIGQINLEWEPDVLAELAGEMDVSGLFNADELAELAMPSAIEPGAGGDEFDATPAEGPTRAQLGDLWIIGGVHRLVVGDCTDPANVARLMDGEEAVLSEIDPPYEMDVQAQAAVCAASFGCKVVWGVVPEILKVFQAWGRLPTHESIWRFHFGRMYSHKRPFMHHRNIYFFDQNYYDSTWRNENGAPPSSFYEAAYVSQHHAHEKPLSVLMPILQIYSPPDACIYVPFGGSGATLIAAHRTQRKARLMEIEPRFADVILRRAETEGLTCERVADVA